MHVPITHIHNSQEVPVTTTAEPEQEFVECDGRNCHKTVTLAKAETPEHGWYFSAPLADGSPEEVFCPGCWEEGEQRV